MELMIVLIILAAIFGWKSVISDLARAFIVIIGWGVFCLTALTYLPPWLALFACVITAIWAIRWFFGGSE